MRTGHLIGRSCSRGGSQTTGEINDQFIITNSSRCHYTGLHESTAGADASVEVPKLHNIKVLIASFYTHIDYNYHGEHL